MIKVSILGLGLIGGSIARSLRECGEDIFITAVSGHKETIDAALSDGVIDRGNSRLSDQLEGSDFIILAAPVDINIRYLEEVKPYLSENTVLTDAGSVKRPIMRAADASRLSDCFIGGHPMAGSEKKGYDNSSSDLLKGAKYIITPGASSSSYDVDRLKRLVTLIGSEPVVMSPEEHDRSTALVSHVPHVVSAALVNLVRDNENSDGILGKLAAGGFKDITRISSSDPGLWRQICLENREEIALLLGDYAEEILRIRKELEAGDGEALESMFAKAREYRTGL